MKNQIVGIIIIGIAALIGLIVFSFNRALTKIVSDACSEGPTCPMWGMIDFQTNISIGLMVLVVVVGLYLIFFGREEKTITKIETVKQQLEPKRITTENYQEIMKSLNPEEKTVLEKIIEAQGTIFQSNLVEQTGFTKVKVTRILDKLEGRGLLERKRRGMTNVVILKS